MKTFAKYSTASQFGDLYFQIKLIFITDTSYWVPLGILGASFGWQWIVAICIEQTINAITLNAYSFTRDKQISPLSVIGEQTFLCMAILFKLTILGIQFGKLNKFTLAWCWNLFIWHKHAQGLFLGNFENSPFLSYR